MNKRILGSAVAALSFIGAGAAIAAPSSSGNKLQCFDGTQDTVWYAENQLPYTFSGTCTLLPGGSAELDNTDVSGADGTYSGVYIQNTNLGGKSLIDINQLGFSYTGGSGVRITFPADVNGDGDYESFISAEAANCNDGAGNVDVVNDPTCHVGYNNGAVGPLYENWAALLADPVNADVQVATDYDAFIINDNPGQETIISGARFGRAAAKTKK